MLLSLEGCKGKVVDVVAEISGKIALLTLLAGHLILF